MGSLVWWEKTVEYNFLLAAARKRGISFVAPLSGVAERGAGDSVFAKDSKIFLVEFKRSTGEFDSEFTKFVCYEDAREELASQDEHHFFVYGAEFKRDGMADLGLRACRYFSKVEKDDVLDVLSSGWSPQEFKEYLVKLIAHRKTDGRSTGTIGPESVTAAFGVRPDKSATVVSLSEYCQAELPNMYEADATVEPPTPRPAPRW